MQTNERKLTAPLLTRFGTGLGLVMIGLAWFIAHIRGQSLAAWFPAAHWPVDVALGATLGGILALLVWQLDYFIPALRRIRELLLTTLDLQTFSYRDALFLGILAGLPEEMLFRGAIQPVIGWLVTSVLFGALHSLTRTYFLYATIAGLVLGGLTLWRSNLWASVAAHCIFDMVTFIFLIQSWRKQQTKS